MSVARQLYQLQEVDLELAANEQALADITQRLGDSPAVTEAHIHLSQEQQRLEELKAQQRSAEWDIDDLRAKLKVVEQKLYGGLVGNPKELANLQREAEGLKLRCGQVEDRALGIMEQVSEGEAGIVALGAELGKLESEWRREQERLQADAGRHQAAIADLKPKREHIVAGIERAAVDIYNEAKRKGRAVARVEQGTCRGCGISLSTAQLQQAKGDRLVRCGSCGRILFFA